MGQTKRTMRDTRELKNRVINLRLSESDYETLLNLVDETGLSGSELIRQALRREWAELSARSKKKRSR